MTVFILGLIIGMAFGTTVAVNLLPAGVSDGWASLIGALIGASLTSASALFVVHKQHKLNIRAKSEEQFHNIFNVIGWIDDIFTDYEEFHSSEHWRTLSETEGVMRNVNKDILVITSKCKRQIAYLVKDLTNVTEELTDLKLPDTIPITIRRSFRECLRPIRLIKEDWENLRPITLVKEDDHVKFFHATYDMAVSILPAEIRGFRQQARILRAEIEEIIEGRSATPAIWTRK